MGKISKQIKSKKKSAGVINIQGASFFQYFIILSVSLLFFLCLFHGFIYFRFSSFYLQNLA